MVLGFLTEMSLRGAWWLTYGLSNFVLGGLWFSPK